MKDRAEDQKSTKQSTVMFSLMVISSALQKIASVTNEIISR